MAAAALALAAAGGGSYAVVRAVSPPAGPELVAPAAQPSMAGQPATAAVPRGAGGVDAAGPGRRRRTGPGPGSRRRGRANRDRGPGGAGRGIPPLSRSAGQGDPGPLPPGALPGDGAVPGASPAVQALAAARAATTALPHSPRLLAQLAAGARAPPRRPLRGDALRARHPRRRRPPRPTPARAPRPARLCRPSPAPGSAASSIAPVGLSPAGGRGPGRRRWPRRDRTRWPASTSPGSSTRSAQYPGGAAIDWSAVAAAGYKFAAVKATEGDYYVNPWAARDVASAKAAGLDVAPYHFAIPNASGGAAQAQFAVEYSGYTAGPADAAADAGHRVRPVQRDRPRQRVLRADAAAMTAWLHRVRHHRRTLTGQYPVIYTTADWWDTCTGRSAAFGADPMWIAAYGFASPPRPAGWSVWTYWQYTSGGTVPGVPGAAGHRPRHVQPRPSA